MRITNSMMIYNMMNNLGNNLQRLDKYQQQLATGKVINVPSDDPIVAARALKLRTDVSQIGQYRRNVDDANSWMDITETTLAHIGEVLQRARELAVEGANGSMTQSDMQNILEEVEQLKTQLIQLGNTAYAGRFIFSGYSTDKKLLNDDGTFAIDVISINDPVNNIKREDINYEIGVQDSININVPGGEIFNLGQDAIGSAATSGQTTGMFDIASLVIDASNNTLNLTVDGENVSITIPPATYPDAAALAAAIQTEVNNATMIAADITVTNVGDKLKFVSGSTGDESAILIDAASSAVVNLGLGMNVQKNGTFSTGGLIKHFNDYIAVLAAGDFNAVGQIIADLDADINNVSRARADVGARMNRLELTQNRLENDYVSFTKLMSQNEDVDMARTIMNLKNEENVYNASLSGGARIIQPSLVDFLK